MKDDMHKKLREHGADDKDCDKLDKALEEGDVEGLEEVKK
jgi:hypothetical protein